LKKEKPCLPRLDREHPIFQPVLQGKKGKKKRYLRMGEDRREKKIGFH